MKNTRTFAMVPLLLSLLLACNSLTPTEVTPAAEVNTGVETAAATAIAVAEIATATPTPIAETATPTATPTVEPATATPTAIPTSSPRPTVARLQLEIVQSQLWADRDGNVRVNVLLLNPYDFPVRPSSRARASLFNSAGEFMRDQEFYFLDGISGGGGFILPGETIAAHACFTCESAPLTEAWATVEFAFNIEEAINEWDYFTEVEASAGSVSFDGDSPIFNVSGTVTNNSDSALDRISVRVFLYDQAGNLVGAAEASAWDVGPGAAVPFDSYGIGQAPDGSFDYEVTALGVNY